MWLEWELGRSHCASLRPRPQGCPRPQAFSMPRKREGPRHRQFSPIERINGRQAEGGRTPLQGPPSPRSKPRSQSGPVSLLPIGSLQADTGARWM